MKIQKYLDRIKQARNSKTINANGPRCPDEKSIRDLGAVGNLTMGMDCSFRDIYSLLLNSPGFNLIYDGMEREGEEYGEKRKMEAIEGELRERKLDFANLLEQEVECGNVTKTAEIEEILYLGGEISEDQYLELCGRTSVYPQDRGVHPMNVHFKYIKDDKRANIMLYSGGDGLSRMIYLKDQRDSKYIDPELEKAKEDPGYGEIKDFQDNHSRQTIILGPSESKDEPSASEEASKDSLVSLIEEVLMPNQIPFMLGPLSCEDRKDLSGVPMYLPGTPEE